MYMNVDILCNKRVSHSVRFSSITSLEEKFSFYFKFEENNPERSYVENVVKT